MNISTENINTLAQLASSISDGDYVYIYKASSNSFARIEKSLLLQGASGGADISEILSNDWNDSSRQHVPSARQMNLVYNNLISAYNSLAAVVEALANSSFKTARPVIEALDWVGSSSSYSIGYNLTHCHKSQASPTSVAEGDSFTAEILPDAGYTLVGVQATGTGFTQHYSTANGSIIISASNVQNGMTISCVAATYQVSIDYDLTGFASEEDTTMQSGGSFTKVLSPNEGYSVKTIVITMGGVNITSSAWTASTRTISIPVVTGSIVITATAEESHNPIVDYVLSDVVKTSGPDELEYDSTLTAVLTKGSGFHGIKDGQFGSTSVGFIPRDIIVFMGGLPLEQGVGKDFTAEASGNNITVTIPHVTANVTIMNVQWVNGSIHSDGGIDGTNSTRGVRIEEFVPIPTGCESIAIMHNFVSGGVDQAVGYGFTAIYEADKSSCVTRQFKGRRVLHFPTGTYSYIRFCAYQWATLTNESVGDQVWGTGGSNNGIDFCYLYDETHEKFIWKGRNVTALVTTPE